MGSLVHTNGNLLCAVDIETTGLDPNEHEIIQIAILPLDEHLKPNKQYMPFNMHLIPGRPENIDPKAMAVSKTQLSWIMQHGIDQFKAADLLEEWHSRLKLAPKKRIMPLGHNYVFDRAFIIEWLGIANYEYLFHHLYRDSMSSALYLNDKAAIHSVRPPFPKLKLSSLAARLNIDYSKAHDALEDCVITAEVYRRMMRSFAG